MKRHAIGCLALLMTAAWLPATAESPQQFDGYLVNYTAVSTADLPAKVALNYGIVRSRSEALLNVAVRRKKSDGNSTAVPARIGGEVHNLSGQAKNLNLREIREGQAIYYIAELNVADGETLVFNLDVLPEGASHAFHINFRQQFFAE